MDYKKISIGIDEATKRIKDKKKNIIKEILISSLRAVDPFEIMKTSLTNNEGIIDINNVKYDLNKYKDIYLVSIGKASMPMAFAAQEAIGKYIKKGIVLTKSIDDLYKNKIKNNFEILTGGHPVPDKNSIDSTKNIIELLKNTNQNDLVIFLISGGGSALMTHPNNNITLIELQHMTNLLLSCGANIDEINSVRKHLDKVKGGGLAKLAYPSQSISFILSDVIGNGLEVIASGPTYYDSTSFKNALGTISKYNLSSKVPSNILSTLKRGDEGLISETVKPGDVFINNVNNIIIASNLTAAQAAEKKAKYFSLNSSIYTTYLSGEAKHVGLTLSAFIKEIVYNNQPLQKPACIICGGESTVSIKGDGFGGRNLELALGSVEALSGQEDIVFITLATDGEDGPTDAAGAVVTGDTYNIGKSLGLLPRDYLKRNDSYNYFNNIGSIIKIGSTGTNVNDLNFIFVF